MLSDDGLHYLVRETAEARDEKGFELVILNKLTRLPTKRTVLPLALPVLALASFWACSSPSTTRATSIAFTQALPSWLQTSAHAMVSTTLTNDSGNKGVDWSVTCGSSSCGSLNPRHTASGSATTFTAPAVIPAGNAVTITATASADTSKSVFATVMITGAAVSITFAKAPPASLGTGAQAMISATVSNDSLNAGVDWAVTCGNSTCGSLNPAHTASGDSTTFTAPVAISKTITVTITATASADTSKSVVAKMTITPRTISFTQAPPASLVTSVQAMISATVLNDPANLGVDWSVTCGSSDCGSFNPTHTASGSATTYTAPATIPTGNIVTVTATSTANIADTVSAKITITASALSLLKGPYAFLFSGNDANGFFAVAGAILADGNGHITKGEEDFSDTSFVSPGDTLSGTYTLGSDGRGSMTLHVSDPKVGVNGVETLSFAVISSHRALVIEFDRSATSSGTLDLQNPANFSTGSVVGGYSFSFRGTLMLSGNTGGLTQFAVYVTAGQGVLLLELDTTSFSIGAAFSQSGGISASTFKGRYAVNLSAAAISAFTEEDLTGQFVADGISALMGGADINQFTVATPPISKLFPNTSLTGTFVANSSGRFTGTVISSVTGSLNLVYYVASGSNVLFIGVDSTQVTAGAMQSQQF
jgi:hypothetical protein